MKVAILGYARQGKSVYAYYRSKGADITICDQKTDIEIPEGANSSLGADYLRGLNSYDVIVRTPFLHPKKILLANAGTPSVMQKVTTATNIFFDECDTPVIGVTGTKGKGTTSLLIEAILKAAGYRVSLGGNIGISPIDMLDDAREADYVVLELANFQTMDMQHSPSICVCLAVKEEHLDWHTDYSEYMNAKAQMFYNQGSGDQAVYCQDNEDSRKIASRSPSLNMRGYSAGDNENAYVNIRDGVIYANGQTAANVSDVKLIGEHNLQNVAAAIAAVWDILKGDPGPIKAALDTCTGFEMRLETVRRIGGVSYVNDSFGSAPDASIAAIKAIAGPKIMIVGGHDKGVDMSPFIESIARGNVKHLIAIGDTGPDIADKVRQMNPEVTVTADLTNMLDIVSTASQHAKRGDTVLLSTGSASFGLFKDYMDRGRQFNSAVEAL